MNTVNNKIDKINRENIQIYIIGANGYIGNSLMRILNKVTKDGVIKINTEQYLKTKLKVKSNSVCFILSSISDEYICENNKTLARRINIDLIKKLCDNNFSKLIFTSTTSLYSNCDDTANEESEISDANFYLYTKIIGENLIRECNSNNIICRLSTVIGNSHNMRKDIFPNSIFFEKNPINVYGLRTYKPYFSIGDTVIGLINMLYYDDYKIINIGNNEMNLSKEIILKTVNSINPGIKFKIKSINPKYNFKNYTVNFDRFQQRSNKYTNLEEILKGLNNYYKSGTNIKL
jgi:nucleoside-diphosphate-sugar epimerase